MYRTFELSEIAMLQSAAINEIVVENISAEAMIQKILGVMALAAKITEQFDEK